MLPLQLPSPLVEVRDTRVESRGVCLYLKRDDLIHAELPGNKWRKLKYNIGAAREQGMSTLLASVERTRITSERLRRPVTISTSTRSR